MDAKLFTFAVPSQNSDAFLMGWGKYEISDKDSGSPLLQSSQARIHIQGDNTGTVTFDSVQPNEMIRLNLGADKHIHIVSDMVKPKNRVSIIE